MQANKARPAKSCIFFMNLLRSAKKIVKQLSPEVKGRFSGKHAVAAACQVRKVMITLADDS